MTVESWIASYFESLNKPDSAIGKSEALALKCSNFPKALFRYRSVERLAYCLEELRDGYVFLNNPDAFNDPYDSALSTSLERFFSQALEPYGYGDPSTVSEFIESIDKEAKEHLHMEGKLFLQLDPDALRNEPSRSRSLQCPPKRGSGELLYNKFELGCHVESLRKAAHRNLYRVFGLLYGGERRIFRTGAPGEVRRKALRLHSGFLVLSA